MPSLPIPMISALVLGFLLLWVRVTGRRLGPLFPLLALCALQGLVISLAQHYRAPGFALVQPLTAALIPPMAWVAFQTTAVRRPAISDALHLLGPLVALLGLVTAPASLDTLIPALFFGYGFAILRAGLPGADALPRMRLASGDIPGRIWRVIGAALLASALSDVLIVAVQIAGAGFLQPWIVSIFSGTLLLVIGALSLSPALEATPADPDDPPERSVSDADVAIMANLDALMASRQLYLNPDLTLSLLSRRLRVPAKQLSAAINRVTGGNVSRYVNSARIAAAQEALLRGETITGAMLSAGFNTKSNFNREFLRVAGQSPSDWLACRRAPGDPP